MEVNLLNKQQSVPGTNQYWEQQW